MSSRGLSELVLIVEDVLAAAAFYREVVGLAPETEPNAEWAWFWAGEPGVHQRIALHKGTLLFGDQSPLPGGERWGPIHFALEVAREDLAEAVERVKASGREVYGPVAFEWMQAESYYFYDLDGNLVEWWSPNE